MHTKLVIWNRFCDDHKVSGNGVPLFEDKEYRVDLIPYGRNRRYVLKRSERMEAMVVNEVEKVNLDFDRKANRYEGLIYMIFWKRDNGVMPLYIGKSEKYGRKSGNLSENIRNIRANRGKFCRWGYNYAYHVGDLSAVVCEGHAEETVSLKYRKWAERLFKGYPTSSPELKEPVYFWISAWKRGDIGPWREWGATSLTFLEYLLIGLASEIFPGILMNEEGANRK